jgi:Amt family ammonium transporter
MSATAINVTYESSFVHDYVWLLTSAFLVLTMQAGFALYESSLIRPKNTHNVLLKNMLDGCVGAITFFCVGYGIAFGSGNAFMGLDKFFGIGLSSKETAFYLFQFSFAATCSTIMSGALAERVNFFSYVIMCGFVNSFIYAFVAHWIWNSQGWLASWGFYDFAGCAVVHMVGGFAGLAGSLFIGPRLGKFERDSKGKKVTNEIPMANPGMAILGVFILQWGWFGNIF